MTVRILAGIGALTIAYHATAFVLGIIEGLRPGIFTSPQRYPRLRLVWSSNKEVK